MLLNEYVIHWGPSQNVLQYWQEVGRAGRDGRSATAVMYLPKRSLHKKRVEREMVDLASCSRDVCLRKAILSSLQTPAVTEDEIESCCGKHRCCSHCANQSPSQPHSHDDTETDSDTD